MGEGDQCPGAYDRAILRYSAIETILPSGTCWSAHLRDPLFIICFTKHNSILRPLPGNSWLCEGDECNGAYDHAVFYYSTIETILPSGAYWFALLY